MTDNHPNSLKNYPNNHHQMAGRGHQQPPTDESKHPINKSRAQSNQPRSGPHTETSSFRNHNEDGKSSMNNSSMLNKEYYINEINITKLKHQFLKNSQSRISLTPVKVNENQQQNSPLQIEQNQPQIKSELKFEILNNMQKNEGLYYYGRHGSAEASDGGSKLPEQLLSKADCGQFGQKKGKEHILVPLAESRHLARKELLDPIDDSSTDFYTSCSILKGSSKFRGVLESGKLVSIPADFDDHRDCVKLSNSRPATVTESANDFERLREFHGEEMMASLTSGKKRFMTRKKESLEGRGSGELEFQAPAASGSLRGAGFDPYVEDEIEGRRLEKDFAGHTFGVVHQRVDDGGIDLVIPETEIEVDAGDVPGFRSFKMLKEIKNDLAARKYKRIEKLPVKEFKKLKNKRTQILKELRTASRNKTPKMEEGSSNTSSVIQPNQITTYSATHNQQSNNAHKYYQTYSMNNQDHRDQPPQNHPHYDFQQFSHDQDHLDQDTHNSSMMVPQHHQVHQPTRNQQSLQADPYYKAPAVQKADHNRSMGPVMGAPNPSHINSQANTISLNSVLDSSKNQSSLSHISTTPLSQEEVLGQIQGSGSTQLDGRSTFCVMSKKRNTSKYINLNSHLQGLNTTSMSNPSGIRNPAIRSHNNSFNLAQSKPKNPTTTPEAGHEVSRSEFSKCQKRTDEALQRISNETRERSSDARKGYKLRKNLESKFSRNRAKNAKNESHSQNTDTSFYNKKKKHQSKNNATKTTKVVSAALNKAKTMSKSRSKTRKNFIKKIRKMSSGESKRFKTSFRYGTKDARFSLVSKRDNPAPKKERSRVSSGGRSQPRKKKSRPSRNPTNLRDLREAKRKESGTSSNLAKLRLNERSKSHNRSELSSKASSNHTYSSKKKYRKRKEGQFKRFTKFEKNARGVFSRLKKGARFNPLINRKDKKDRLHGKGGLDAKKARKLNFSVNKRRKKTSALRALGKIKKGLKVGTSVRDYLTRDAGRGGDEKKTGLARTGAKSRSGGSQKSSKLKHFRSKSFDNVYLANFFKNRSKNRIKSRKEKATGQKASSSVKQTSSPRHLEEETDQGMVHSTSMDAGIGSSHKPGQRRRRNSRLRNEEHQNQCHAESKSLDLGVLGIYGDDDDEEDLYGEEHEPVYKNTMQAFTIRTRRGKANNVDKTNQDSFIAQPNLNGCPDTHLFGVYDGHGINGHLVSNFISSQLPAVLNNVQRARATQGGEQTIEDNLEEVYKCLFQSLMAGDIDITYSGSTAITCFVSGNSIYTANCGDSRAVLGFRNEEGKWAYQSLSRDHKPGLEDEMQRIYQCGGRVEPYLIEGEYLGPNRVWLRDENVPGLAMSRSIGDLVAASVGVAWMPEIYRHEIRLSDEFLIIASDGVWEFLSNEDVVEIVSFFKERGDLEGACDAIMGESLKKWEKEEIDCIDDITFVVVFFAPQEVKG